MPPIIYEHIYIYISTHFLYRMTNSDHNKTVCICHCLFVLRLKTYCNNVLWNLQNEINSCKKKKCGGQRAQIWEVRALPHAYPTSAMSVHSRQRNHLGLFWSQPRAQILCCFFFSFFLEWATLLDTVSTVSSGTASFGPWQ